MADGPLPAFQHTLLEPWCGKPAKCELCALYR